MPYTIDQIKQALQGVMDPDLNRPLLELNMIDDIKIDGANDVSLTVYLTTPACPLKEKIQTDVTEALKALPDIGNLEIKMSHRTLGGGESAQMAPGVRNFIAVASGKGGVGKSTTAVNLALALADSGAQVGLLDGDITGPSIPHMLGVSDWQPQVSGDVIHPLEIHGLKVMSIGFFVGTGEAVVWRGPMLHKALSQFLSQVQWGELDYLIIDLPPGTGDVQLSLVQLVPLTGAVVVSTPQDVALIDVRKCMTMFQNAKVEILGMIENMSVFVCPHCSGESYIFGEGGVVAEAKALDLNFLGQIPLRAKIRLAGDAGSPAFLEQGDSADDYRTIAKQVASRVSIFRLSGKKPQKVSVQR